MGWMVCSLWKRVLGGLYQDVVCIACGNFKVQISQTQHKRQKEQLTICWAMRPKNYLCNAKSKPNKATENQN